MYLIMQFPPFSCYFLFLVSKYSPQHSVFNHPQFMLFLHSERPSFISVQNNRYFIFCCAESCMWDLRFSWQWSFKSSLLGCDTV
jgi:hypothetical protein